MTKHRTIKQIRVQRLFGRYTYVLPEISEEIETDDIFILYGDNGCGKTTVLELLFHLVASADDRGHKTAISKIPFQTFEVEFSDGSIISASRPADDLVGSFRFAVRNGLGVSMEVYLRVNDDGVIKIQDEDIVRKLSAVLAFINDLKITPYLLSDNRTVQYDQSIRVQARRHSSDSNDREISELIREMHYKERFDPSDFTNLLLKQSLTRAYSWIRSKVLQESSVGESNVNSLYTEILTRVVSQPVARGYQNKNVNREDLLDRLNSLEERSLSFSRFGLVPSFKASELKQIIASADASHLPIIQSVLDPYVDSVEAKLRALSESQGLLERFIDEINGFLGDKKMSFHLRRGFAVKSGNTILKPDMLSSGERHLLLLFCNTITALENPTVFIVDEPELSLNIKWQRKLLDSLGRCIGDSPVQYIFATHSMEILSKHMKNVVTLRPKDDGFIWQNL